ncbi:MAG: hypothetical protein WKF59_16595 [Chitinophagaceae bacterium]
MNVLNENLEKANITKAKLFSIISHDLRSPISQVYQFLDLQRTNPDILANECCRRSSPGNDGRPADLEQNTNAAIHHY